MRTSQYKPLKLLIYMIFCGQLPDPISQLLFRLAVNKLTKHQGSKSTKPHGSPGFTAKRSQLASPFIEPLPTSLQCPSPHQHQRPMHNGGSLEQELSS
jgi:hypothetical protein